MPNIYDRVENAHQKVLTITDLMQHTKLSNERTGQLCLYYSDYEFKILKFDNLLSSSLYNITIQQMCYGYYYDNHLMFLININDRNHVYYINSSHNENDLIKDVVNNTPLAKSMLGEDLFETNQHTEEELKMLTFDCCECKPFPFQFRKGEQVIEIDRSGMLFKTNLNSIWDIPVGLLDFNNNRVRHVVFGGHDEDTIPLGRDINGLNYCEIEFNDEIIDFSTYGHSVFLTKSGKVYGFGMNTYRQLNIDGPNDNIIEFITDISMENEKVIKVIPGPYKTHFITENGKIYACGENSNFLTGYSEGNTKEQVYEIIKEDSGSFHSGPAKECDLLHGYDIINVYSIGMGNACAFLTRDNKLIICGRYPNSNGHDVISVGQVYNNYKMVEMNDDGGEIDQIHVLDSKYILIITTTRKVHIIGQSSFNDYSYISNLGRRNEYLVDQAQRFYYIELVKTQIEILLSLDERIYGKLTIHTNVYGMGCAFMFDLPSGLLRFFKSMLQMNNSKHFSDVSIILH